MPSLSKRIAINISASAVGAQVPSFGIPMILAYHTHYSDLIRYYSSLAGVTGDGFSTTDPAYLAAQAILDSNPTVNSFAIGRKTHTPTQLIQLTPTALANAVYNVTINGQLFTTTAGGSPTVAGIISALVTAIGSNVSGVTPTSGGGNTYLLLTGTAGAWFSWSVSDNSGSPNGMGLWSAKDASASANADTDITNIFAADKGWYSFLSTFQNAADGALLAAWAESNKRLHMIDLADNDMKGSGSSDFASTAQAAAYNYTAVSYKQTMASFFSAGWLGRVLPLQPGSETWMYKTIPGQVADVLTDTEELHLDGKNANYYDNLGGVSITENGKCASGQFIDTTRGLDWLKSVMQVGIYNVLLNNPKVPYTDAGVAIIEKEVRQALSQGIQVGLLSATPSPTVIAPLVANESSANRSARTIPDITFTAQGAGAIHNVTVTGTVSF